MVKFRGYLGPKGEREEKEGPQLKTKYSPFEGTSWKNLENKVYVEVSGQLHAISATYNVLIGWCLPKRKGFPWPGLQRSLIFFLKVLRKYIHFAWIERQQRKTDREARK